MNSIPTYRQGRSIHHSSGDTKGCKGFCSILFLSFAIVAPILTLLWSEQNRYEMHTALLQALDSDIIELNQLHEIADTDETDASVGLGDIIMNFARQHKHSNHYPKRPLLGHGITSHIQSSVTDPQMSLTIAGALQLQRHTEYCQWHEYQSQECETCTRTVEAKDGSTKQESYQCHCITRYSYVKQWTSRQISSLGFDQPAAHYNPNRNPLPSKKFVAKDAIVTMDLDSMRQEAPHSSSTHSNRPDSVNAEVHPGMLHSIRKGTSRHVQWTRHATPPIPPFWKRWIPDKTRYEDLADLPQHHLPHQRPRTISSASSNEDFTYVGNGYFFSPYQASMHETLFKHFMQYTEGTLFDFQFGDIIPSCTPGDIRLYYTVIDPAQVSVLGQISPASTSSTSASSSSSSMSKSDIMIQPAPMKGMNLGLTHVGSKSVQEMILAQDSDSYWFAMAIRVLFLLVGCSTLIRLVGAYMGRSIANSSWSTHVACLLSFFCFVLGLVWIKTWGASAWEMDTLFLFLASAALFVGVIVPYPPPFAESYGGLRAVWCMIGRWAGVPPSWRVEKGYRNGTTSTRSASTGPSSGKEKKS